MTMNRATVLAAIVASAAIALWLLRPSAPAYTPTPDPRAYLQFAFEGNLDTLAPTPVEASVIDGDLVYGEGTTGQTFAAQGDGSALVITTRDLYDLAEVVEITLDFRPEAWTNPHKGSAAVQTMVVLSGRSGEKLRHLTIDLPAHTSPEFRVTFEDIEGAKHTLTTPAADFELEWHNVRIRANRASGRTEVFLNGTSIGTLEALPSGITHGIDTIKLGTWFRQNQAFRGQIDNLIIRDASS